MNRVLAFASYLRTWMSAAAFAVLMAARTDAASVAEPATVFYGKIIGTAGAQPFQVTDGELEWTVRRADGQNLKLRAKLFPIQGGLYSYRINVPHDAIGAGLPPTPTSVPLGSIEQTFQLSGMLVNGKPARVAGSSAGTFKTAQTLRAATYRLDLEVPIEPLDSNGDGIPDWWEKKYGLDKFTGNDADGDGISNLAEYLQGSDPTKANSAPTLTTTELLAYADGSTGVVLQTVDSDSAPAALIYTLTKAPAVGTFLLNGSALVGGANFTHQDVLDGRVQYRQSGGATEAVSFDLSVRDENPAHPPSTGTIQLKLYQPAADSFSGFSSEQLLVKALNNQTISTGDSVEAQRLRNYVLSKGAEYVVWEGAAEIKGATDQPNVIVGGSAKGTLTGGNKADILIGRGADDILRGNGGADRFEFHAGDKGRTTVADFKAEEGDILDLSQLLQGTATLLGSYLRLGNEAGNLTLNIDANGDGSGFIDLVIVLTGVPAGSVDLYTLLDHGNLVTGGIQLVPRVSVAATTPFAGENGPDNGEFTFTRSGGIETELTVQFSVGGSASNGTDYSKIGSSIRFAPGAKTATLQIVPFADAQPEPAETVELVLSAGAGYELGSADRAAVTIEDLQVLITIEAIEPVAITQSLTPGAFMVRRSGIVDRSAVIRLDIGGTALAGTDYQALPRFVNFAAGQTTALLEVTPKAGSVAGSDGKTVRVSVLSDAAYKLGKSAQATVTLVDSDSTFAAWRARSFPDSSGGLQAFASSDPGGAGIPTLLRYAFGLDPANPNAGQLPKTSIRDGRLTTEFWRRDASDIEYVVSISTDLVKWDSSPAAVERVTQSGGDAHIARYRSVAPTSSERKLFMNVRVILKP